MFTKRLIYLCISLLLSTFFIAACSSNQTAENLYEKELSIESKKKLSPKRINKTLQDSSVDHQAASSDSTQGATKQTYEKRARHPIASLAMKSSASAPTMPAYMYGQLQPNNRENYAHLEQNGIKQVRQNPVSTFSIDVDTGSYSNIRRILHGGHLPPHDAVRIEEMMNYFSYDYKAPKNLEQPFQVTTETAPAPWNHEKRLLHIGIKGYEVNHDQLPPANLVFLVDVSGSMHSANKLPLLKSALKMLSRQLSAHDRISLVVYAGASGVVLSPTPGNHTAQIALALNTLQAGGSTNGGAGIQLAYAMAKQAFIKGGINRVILASDGDFNVGTTDFQSLMDLIEKKRESGISFTVLGFGSGNYNDHMMEQLADKGNGNYAYIDSIHEARKVLIDEIGSTLMTIASDVKIQIEFNPDVVSEYRLIGYENRALQREDFNNDQVDAGEIGAGHSVTALYELTLTGNKASVDPLRYGSETEQRKSLSHTNQEFAFLRLRYKQLGSNVSKLIEYPLYKNKIKNKLNKSSHTFRFAASVAAFGELLRGGKYSGQMGYDDILNLARHAIHKDDSGYQAEFLNLVRTAAALDQ